MTRLILGGSALVVGAKGGGEKLARFMGVAWSHRRWLLLACRSVLANGGPVDKTVRVSEVI